MTKALIGLDIGTTTTKAVVFNTSGMELSRAVSPPYPKQMPQANWVEQDPEKIWQAVVTTIRTAIEKLESEVQILALSIAAQSGSLVPTDLDGNPVYPIITWMDGRTETLIQQWKENSISEEVKSISGWSLYAGLCLPTIAWLRENDPVTFSAAQRFLSVNDFVAFRLTGKFCTNPSNAGGMQLVDLNTGIWSKELLTLAGISREQLSPIQPTGAVIGNITATETGLPFKTMLINGGHDQGMAALGLGVNSSGKILLACGTAWVITGVTETLDISAAPSTLDWNAHPLNDRWTNSQSLGGLGASIDWWVNQAWRGVEGNSSRAEMYSALDAAISDAGPTKGLFFLPVTGGHDSPATIKNGGFIGLKLNHDRTHMAWAVMESAAFELRWALETIQQKGLPIDRLWMMGGAAESTYWPSILVNITGIPIYLPQYDNWPSQGAAIIAGSGVGIFENVEDGIKAFQKPFRSEMPDKTMAAYYDNAFENYKQHKNILGLNPNN